MDEEEEVEEVEEEEEDKEEDESDRQEARIVEGKVRLHPLRLHVLPSVLLQRLLDALHQHRGDVRAAEVGHLRRRGRRRVRERR